MSPLRALLQLLPVLLILLLPSPRAEAHTRAAGRLAEVEVYDRSEGRWLPVHRHRGRLYIAGEPGHEYEIRVRSRHGGRLLAVTSVDGVNVLSGETASTDQGGYVLAPHGEVRIDGWRKSLDRVATFYFTALPDSYAARTGRPDDVGVIGVALFRERHPHRFEPWPDHGPWDRSRDEFDASGGAPEPELHSGAGAEGRAQDGAAAPSAGMSKRESRLGTGHGRSQWSGAELTTFERAGEVPDELIVIEYDTRRRLVARGILPRHAPPPRHGPRPFPGGFAPDPPD